MSALVKLLVALLLLLSVCKSDKYACNSAKYDYLPVSDFKIDMDALENGDTVKVISFSDGPWNNNEGEFYYQYIVVSKRTGDTVRVLAPYNHGLENDTKTFIDGKSVLHTTRQDGTKGEILFNAEKVVYNKKDGPVLNEKYSTTIGLLAEVTVQVEGKKSHWWDWIFR